MMGGTEKLEGLCRPLKLSDFSHLAAAQEGTCGQGLPVKGGNQAARVMMSPQPSWPAGYEVIKDSLVL